MDIKSLGAIAVFVLMAYALVVGTLLQYRLYKKMKKMVGTGQTKSVEEGLAINAELNRMKIKTFKQTIFLIVIPGILLLIIFPLIDYFFIK